jgi:hypothetical protein
MFTNMPFADRPDLAAAIAERRLSNHEADLVTRFAEEGYVVIDLDLPDFETLAAGIIRDLAPAHARNIRLQDAWSMSPGVRKLACLKKVTDTLALLYGRPAFPFQTLNFSHGSEQLAHSDTIHFHSAPARFMAGVWIALEPADADNGPLEYFPGSQKLPCYTLADAGYRGSGTRIGDYGPYMEFYEPMIQALIKANGYKKHEAHLPAGQALIWSANLLHGGSPIRQAGRTRQSQVTHYYFEDCLYYTPMHSDPLIGKIYHREPINIATGQPVQNRYCGQVFTPPKPARNWLTRAKSRLQRARSPSK